MQAITVDDVLVSFTTCAGESDLIPPSDELADTVFADLGYDSLALYAVVADLEQRFGVRISDEGLSGLETVGQLVELANSSPRESDRQRLQAPDAVGSR